MYITLNPIKIRTFTTKGIRLTLSNPVGFVDPNLELGAREKIDEAIRNEELIVVPDDEQGFIVKGIGSTGTIETEEESKGDLSIDCENINKDKNLQSVKDPFGDMRRVRKVMYTLTMPKESEEESDKIIIARS
jgi:hypothetical protein